MTAARFRRLPRRLSTVLTGNRALLWNNVRVAADAIGCGSRAATRNRLHRRTPGATPRQAATKGKRHRVLVDACAPRRNQERPGAAAIMVAARRDREKSQSRTTASRKEPARLTFVPTVALRSATPLAGTRRKRATAKGNVAAGRAAARRLP